MIANARLVFKTSLPIPLFFRFVAVFIHFGIAVFTGIATIECYTFIFGSSNGLHMACTGFKALSCPPK
jgi:hypothetical protein